MFVFSFNEIMIVKFAPVTVVLMKFFYLFAVAALKTNEILKELFLADNRLMPTDGIQLGNMLKYNHVLELLDLRNNQLQVSHY